MTNPNEIGILVVDEDPDVARGTAGVLERAGFATATALTGAEALECLRANRPDLVVLDCDLPDWDGVEVCRQIKREPAWADVLVVLISGTYIQTEEQVAGLRSGADGYIVRPIGNRELVARVEAFVRIVRLSRALREKNAELQTALAGLRERERQLASLMSSLPGMAYRCHNVPAWSMEFVSEGCAALTGWTPKALMQNVPAYGELIVPTDRQAVWDAIQAAVVTRQDYELIYQIQTANGQIKWVWERGRGVGSEDGGLLFLEGFVMDITERKDAEGALRKTNRALQLLSLFNQELVRASDERALLQAVCLLAVEQGGYRFAWVGFAEEDEAKTVRPVAQSGLDAGYLDQIQITWADTEHGRGPTGAAIRTGQAVIARNIPTDPAFGPWREAAIKRDYASSIALPLHGGGRCIGALNLYAAGTDAFDADEEKLLGELAGDLAYGITALRERAERDRTKAEVERTAQEWQTTFDATNDVIWILDANHRVLRSNKMAAQFFDRPYREMVGEHCWTIVHGATGPHPECPFDRACQSGHRETAELQRGKQWFEVLVDPIRGGAGQYAGAIHIVSDITARKRAEEALRASEERYRAMLDQAADAIIMRDQTGRLLDANQKACQSLGYAREELLSKSIADIDPEAVRNGKDRLWSRVLAGERFTFESRHRRKDGRFFPVEVTLGSVRLPLGPAVLGIVRDITERRVAEEQLKGILAELERSNRELEQFAYAASHDLQEPLRMVSSYAELLAQRYEGQLDERAQKFIHYMRDGVQRMRALIDGLLAYSRAGSRGQPLETTSGQDALDEARQNLAVLIQENRAVITTGGLPGVRAVPSQLVMLFQNLLSNAIKFHGQDLPRIHVSAQEQGGAWLFSVQDNGIGIEPQYADRVFEIFQRLHTREEYPGTGIGLALCKRIVERHGGRIWFASEPGQGTTFFFTVPKQSTPTDDHSTPTREPI